MDFKLLKHALLIHVFRIWFSLDGYYLWSRLYRWLFEKRRYKNEPLVEFDSLRGLETALGRMKWVKDGPKYLWDVISLPAKVEYALRTDPKQEVGDCDEFAAYAADRIQNMIARKKISNTKVFFMTVNWLDAEYKFHGHNVCAILDYTSNRWSHMSNWFEGKVQSGGTSPSDLARSIVAQAGAGGRMIGYAYCTPDLKNTIDVKVPPL